MALRKKLKEERQKALELKHLEDGRHKALELRQKALELTQLKEERRKGKRMKKKGTIRGVRQRRFSNLELVGVLSIPLGAKRKWRRSRRRRRPMHADARRGRTRLYKYPTRATRRGMKVVLGTRVCYWGRG